MKRAIAALAALWMLVAQPSFATKTMFVINTRTPYWSNPIANDDNTTWLYQRREIQATAERLGVDYDCFFDYQVPTINALTSNMYGVQYAGTAYIGYRAGSQQSGWCFPDSVTLYGPWDGAAGRPTNLQRKPQLFFGVPTVSGNASAWKNVAYPLACSTGTDMTIGAFSTSSPAYGVIGGVQRSAFLAGSNLAWKEWDCIMQVPRSAVAPPGILRTIIGFKFADVNRFGDGLQDYFCEDCDNVGSTEPSLSDSLGILWARYPSDPKPSQAMFFCWPTANTAHHGGTYSQAAIVQAFAALDSASGWKVCGQTPGWKPVEMSLVIGRGFSESRPVTAATPPTNFGGAAREGNPDSLMNKKSIRDMGTWGARFTVLTDPDSAIVNRGFMAWWSPLQAQYAVEVTTGLWTGAGVQLTNAGKYRVIDPFGFNRARAIGYFGNPIADNDTTMQGLLRFARARLDSIFPGSASRAVFPGNWDGIPSNFPLRQLPNLDTYNMALWTAGFRVIVWAPDMSNSNPGMTWGQKGQLSQSDWATSNYAYGSAEVRYNVYSDSTARTRIGTILHAQCPTGLIAEPAYRNFKMTHNAANDFLQGVFTGIGLSQDYLNYYHSFRQPRRVFRVEAYSLGGVEQVSPGMGKARYGYWQMKQVVMSMKAVNALAGRELVKFVYVGDL